MMACDASHKAATLCAIKPRNIRPHFDFSPKAKASRPEPANGEIGNLADQAKGWTLAL